jgi:hypothetical protein
VFWRWDSCRPSVHTLFHWILEIISIQVHRTFSNANIFMLILVARSLIANDENMLAM